MPLERIHDLSSFSSGVPALDDWLKRRALANQDSGATRTFVTCRDGNKVIAYYALASGGVAASHAPGLALPSTPRISVKGWAWRSSRMRHAG